MQMTPVLAVHMSAALLALPAGAVALWARRTRTQRPRLHRAFGHAFATLIVVTALSAMFIRDRALPNIAGYTPIHLFVPLALGALFFGILKGLQGRIAAHRRFMQGLYAGTALAGAFALLPQRYLGQRVWTVLGPVLVHTPIWVWGLLAALIAIGALQLRERRVGLVRATLLPLGMTAFSLWGTLSASDGMGLMALGTVWMMAAGAVALPLAPGPVEGSYDAGTRTFALRGSATPLLLIVCLFLVKYAAGVQLALDPARIHDLGRALGLAALYGGFSGAFLGRAARLWRLALPPSLAAAAA